MGMQLSYSQALPAGVVGERAYAGTDDWIVSAVNEDPLTAQVATILVATAADNRAYSITLEGVVVTATSGGGATANSIATLLEAAIEGEPLVSGRVTVSRSTDTLTLTARVAGVGFSLSSADANLTLTAVTANDLADPVAFGAFVVRDDVDGTKARAGAVAAMTARAVTLTPTVVNSAEYTVDILYRGNRYPVAFVADGSATAAEIVTGLSAAINGMTGLDVTASGTNTLILTADVAGQEFDLTYSANLVKTADNKGLFTDINKCGLGVAKRDLRYGTPLGGAAQYPAGVTMSVMKRGYIWVATEEAVDASKDVYVGVSGSAIGKWRGSAASGYALLDRSVAQWVERASAALAVLRVSF